MHAGPPDTADVEALRNEVFELKQKNEQLTMENAELKQKVSLRSRENFFCGINYQGLYY